MKTDTQKLDEVLEAVNKKCMVCGIVNSGIKGCPTTPEECDLIRCPLHKFRNGTYPELEPEKEKK